MIADEIEAEALGGRADRRRGRIERAGLAGEIGADIDHWNLHIGSRFENALQLGHHFLRAKR